jgi:enoyl-CoA hydratase
MSFPIARTLGNCLSMSKISSVVSLVRPVRTKDMIFRARLLEAHKALSLDLLAKIVPDVETLQHRIRHTFSRERGEDLILKA